MRFPNWLNWVNMVIAILMFLAGMAVQYSAVLIVWGLTGKMMPHPMTLAICTGILTVPVSFRSFKRLKLELT